jgi:hypothetical protein
MWTKSYADSLRAMSRSEAGVAGRFVAGKKRTGLGSRPLAAFDPSTIGRISPVHRGRVRGFACYRRLRREPACAPDEQRPLPAQQVSPADHEQRHHDEQREPAPRARKSRPRRCPHAGYREHRVHRVPQSHVIAWRREATPGAAGGLNREERCGRSLRTTVLGSKRLGGFGCSLHAPILPDLDSEWVETKRRRPRETKPRKQKAPGCPGLQVEAPGIEPGSERLPVTGPTCVSRRIYVGGNLRACNRSRSRPYISTRSRRLASRPGPAGADVHTRYPALPGERTAFS